MQKLFKSPKVISSHLINNDVNKIQENFNKLKKIILLPTDWRKENFFEIELKKSLIRGLLRYFNESNSLLTNILSEIKRENFKNFNFNWCTKVYPMIHLSKDRIEPVGFHYDEINNNKLITCWVPITNYNYPALSFINNSEKYPRFFSKIILNTPMSKLLSQNISINKGSAFLWDGRAIHAGNFNSSNEISCAFQFKLTLSPFEHEKSFKIDNIQSISNQSIIFDNSYVEKNYNLYNKIVKLIIENKSLEKLNIKEMIYFVTEILKENFSEKNLILSFASSVLAQRISTSKKFNNNFNFFKKVEKILDIFSIYVGAENLSSFSRLTFGMKKKEIFEFYQLLKKGDIFFTIKEILITNKMN